jgi:DNA-directed RNA polymerase subunit RPC12/RpoP
MIKKTYQCKECKEKFDIILESIHDEKPKEVKCIKEDCSGKATFFWGQLKGSTTIIKDHMKAGGSKSMNYSKINRDQKKFH